MYSGSASAAQLVVDLCINRLERTKTNRETNGPTLHRGADGTSERIVHIAVNQGHFVPDISSPVANPNIIHGRMTGVTNNAN